MLELNEIWFWIWDWKLLLRSIYLFLKLRAENWFLDRMWASDVCAGIMSMKNNIDRSFCGIDLNHHCMKWWATHSYPIPRDQGGCWGCSRARWKDIDVTAFGVSTWNKGDVSGECLYLVSSGGAHCFTVLCIHLSFSTSSGRLNIHMQFLLCSTSISSTSFEYITAQPKTRGIRDKSISRLYY